MEYFKHFLLSLDGNLVSFGMIDDEIIEGNDVHMKSLLVGLITGSTKFDSIEDEKDREKHMNLLKREMYGIFERIS